MRWLVLALCLAAAPAAAQQEENPGFFDRLFKSDETETDEDQGSFLEQLIEEQLSDAGRVVTVTGFEGALSGAATLDSLTIADADGIWLTLKDAELDWNRAALFRGRIEVAKLTAGEILLPRLPVAEGKAAPTPEATGFQLPELPVSIVIDEISAAELQIGQPVFGVEVDLVAQGSVTLEGGEGTAALDVTRLDDKGALTLAAGYSNTSDILELDLSLTEDAGGIFATLAGLPGAPSVAFGIKGTGPVSDYTADIRLATDGAERLAGQVTSFQSGGETGLAADIKGDIAPVFAPEYRPFFGESISLRFRAIQPANGPARVETLSLEANAIKLNGSAVIGTDGLPLRIDLQGQIADAAGGSVLLPLPGLDTRVDRVTLDVAFNAADGDAWAGAFDIEGFQRDSITADRVTLRGIGQIDRGRENRVTADFTYRAQNLDLGSPEAQTAIGDDLSGKALLDWQSGGSLHLKTITLEAEAYALTGEAVISTADDGPLIKGKAKAQANRLEVFSGLAGRSISGAARVDLTVVAAPLAGTFDISAKGSGTDLAINEPRVDAILKGPAKIDVKAKRGAKGLDVTLTTLETPVARLTGKAGLTSGGSTANLSGRLSDGSLVLKGLTGPVDLNVTGREDTNRDWDVTLRLDGEALDLSAEGALSDLYEAPRGSGQASFDIADLSVLSDLAERPLSGQLQVTAKGETDFDLKEFQVDATLTGSGLATGEPDLDKLLGGHLDLTIVALRKGNRTELATFDLKTGVLTTQASGALEKGQSRLRLDTALRDIAPFVAGLNGPIEVKGTLEEVPGDRVRVDLTGTGPGGIRADVTGDTSVDFRALDLALTGNAPLELANRYIAPNTLAGPLLFDLALKGPPQLTSLSGRISASGARFAALELGVALSDIAINTTLAGGRADLDITASVEGGGRVAVRGPIGLTTPSQADITVTLSNAYLADPRLFETDLGGQIRINGPLAGGARISGDLTLGPTEVRIPSSGLGGAGEIPQITHINEPPPVRGTRRRAGLLKSAEGGGGGGPVYGLDVRISAPNQLFVRGRGLDSEFGGALRLGGTTRNVVPSGGFQLIRGRLDILGRRLDLDEARITMEGSFKPRLFLTATTDVEDYSVGVRVSGPADNPDIAFQSSPELPEEEVMSRLIFGRGLETLSALQAARLALAVRTLAGRGGEGVVSKIRSGAGLADLDVTTTEDGDTALRAGAYLNENLYTDVTIDSAGETRLNLNLDVSPSVTVKGGVTNTGDTSIGIYFERDY